MSEYQIAIPVIIITIGVVDAIIHVGLSQPSYRTQG